MSEIEFNEELKKQANEIFSLYAKHSPNGYAITEEDFIWTLAEYDSRQTKVSRVELPFILRELEFWKKAITGALDIIDDAEQSNNIDDTVVNSLRLMLSDYGLKDFIESK